MKKLEINTNYVCKVVVNKATGQKTLTIPKIVPIKAGDFVRIVKVRIEDEIKEAVK